MPRLTATARRATSKTIVLDRSLEALPVFRLSDSSDDGAVIYLPELGGRWRVLPAPGDRLPGTFDQDVYVELLRRYQEGGCPQDGSVIFTLHSFLRSIGRRVDGRTYEQLRSALGRLERTTLESSGVYATAGSEYPLDGSFTILSSVTIERRRLTDQAQLPLFTSMSASEPGDARVVIAQCIRNNVSAGWGVTLSSPVYQSLSNPVARRLYRLLEVFRTEDRATWQVGLERLANQLPLTQRYPSHLQRVLQPAHEMLLAAGVLQNVGFRQVGREWYVDYILAVRSSGISTL